MNRNYRNSNNNNNTVNVWRMKMKDINTQDSEKRRQFEKTANAKGLWKLNRSERERLENTPMTFTKVTLIHLETLKISKLFYIVVVLDFTTEQY